MKVTITKEPEMITADLEKGSKVVSQCNGWVTWVRKDSIGHVHISTCMENEFECQNDTETIELTNEEWKQVKKELK